MVRSIQSEYLHKKYITRLKFQSHANTLNIESTDAKIRMSTFRRIEYSNCVRYVYIGKVPFKYFTYTHFPERNQIQIERSLSNPANGETCPCQCVTGKELIRTFASEISYNSFFINNFFCIG